MRQHKEAQHAAWYATLDKILIRTRDETRNAAWKATTPQLMGHRTRFIAVGVLHTATGNATHAATLDATQRAMHNAIRGF